MKYLLFIALWISSFINMAYAKEQQVTVMLTSPEKTVLGRVTFQDTPYGLLIVPHLAHLPPGVHGFHIHEHPDCSDHGMNAGGHLDPQHTNTHQGPYGNGHLGDLPALVVTSDGQTTLPLLAPRLKTKDLSGQALMIHAGGDTYSDTPPLGGGGARLACGVIQ